jgi:hypothetical protein
MRRLARIGRHSSTVTDLTRPLSVWGAIAVDEAHGERPTPDFPLWLGLNPQANVLDLKWRVRCRGCGARGRAVVSIKVAAGVGAHGLTAFPTPFALRFIFRFVGERVL